MFYEVKVRYLQKVTKKKKSGLWIIKAESFAEAEKKAMVRIDGLISISSMKNVLYYAYCADDNVANGKFFVVEIKNETIEEKPIIDTYLAYSDTVNNSLDIISKNFLIPVVETAKSVKETKIIDIIE